MRVLLLTVAGLSSRFSESVGFPCLKCLYHKNTIQETLLYKMLRHQENFDKIVIVGGFKYDELEQAVKNELYELTKLGNKIILIKNEKYAVYGSGYSFYAGLEVIKNIPYDELVFAEGDLFVDKEAFKSVCKTPKNVMTYNTTPIYADKAVAYYFDLQHKPHYIYDTSHGALNIKEPFLSIFNSGQIWKFTNAALLKQLMSKLTPEERQGTNLIPVNKYFQSIAASDIEMIGFKTWINCNTVKDFNRMKGNE